MKKLVIDQYDDYQRIDKYLKKVLVQAPSSLIYKMLRKKDVKVNGKRVKENYILHLGDEVELFLYEDKFKEYTKPLTIYELPITFKVVYEDAHILIVDKPAGLLVHEDINESVNTLSNQVLTYLYQKGEYDPEKNISFTPGPVHRLDRNTSGLVIFGKDMRALQDLNTMMKTRQGIEKKYLTIAMGHMKDATLSGYVKKNEDEGKMYLVKKDTPGALSMKTIVHVLKRCSTCSLVGVQLITGRTHQIRIHLSATGHPVMGDSKYGDFEWNKEVKKKFHLNHQFLHAYQLTFVDPIGSMSYLKGKTVTSQLPEQLEKIQKELFS